MKATRHQAKAIFEAAMNMRPDDGFVVRCYNGLTGEGYAVIGETRNGRAGVRAETCLDRIRKLERKGRMVAEGLTKTPEFTALLNDNNSGSDPRERGVGFPSKFPNGTEDHVMFEIYQFDRSQLDLSQEYFNDLKSRTQCKVRAEFVAHKDDVDELVVRNLKNDLTVSPEFHNLAKVKFRKKTKGGFNLKKKVV